MTQEGTQTELVVVADAAEAKAPAKKVDVYRTRFSDATWYDWLREVDVLLLGCGGIGSWVALALSRIGCYLTVFDMDSIEVHNLGGQAFPVAAIGTQKVNAIVNLCRNMSGSEARVDIAGEYTERSPVNHIVISAFDNMKSRKLAFEKWAAFVEKCAPRDKAECIFIDGRLLAEDYQIYAVLPGNEDAYRDTLFDVEDKDTDKVACTLKATTHCSMGIASDIVSILTNFAANKAVGEDIRDVPFRVCKSIQSYTYEVSNAPAKEEIKKEVVCQ